MTDPVVQTLDEMLTEFQDAVMNAFPIKFSELQKHSDNIDAIARRIRTHVSRIEAERDALRAEVEFARVESIEWEAKETAYKAEVERLRGAEWRPIETAPKDGTHIVVMNERYFRSWGVATVAHFFEGGWHLTVNRDGEHSEYKDPTHWMPLPEHSDKPEGGA